MELDGNGAHPYLDIFRRCETVPNLPKVMYPGSIETPRVMVHFSASFVKCPLSQTDHFLSTTRTPCRRLVIYL